MIPRLIVIAVIIYSLTVVHTAVGTGDRVELNQEEKSQILNDKIIVRQVPSPDQPGKTFEALGLIKASVSEVYTVLTDFANYSKFMPNNENTEVLQYSEHSAIVNITLNLPLNKTKKYRLHMLMEQSGNIAKVRWQKVHWPGLVSGETIKDTKGYWLITEFPERSGHVLTLYHVYTDPGPIPWGLHWIVDWLVKRSIPGMIKTTRDRIYALQ